LGEGFNFIRQVLARNKSNGQQFGYFFTLLLVVAASKAVLTLVYAAVTIGSESGYLDSRLPVYLAYVIVNTTAGIWLILGSERNTSTAHHFGLIFLFIASPYANASVNAIQEVHGTNAFEVFKYIQVESFAGYVFWLFAESFPSSRLTASVQRFSEIVRLIFLNLGLLLFLVNFSLFFDVIAAAEMPLIEIFSRSRFPSLYWPSVFFTLLAGIGFLLWRIPKSNEIVKRRLKFLALAIAIGFGPMLIITILDNLSETAREFFRRTHPLSFVFVDVFMLTLPVTSAFALINHQVLELQHRFRSAMLFRFARLSVLAGIALPCFLVVLILYFDRGLPLNQVFSNNSGVLLLLVTISFLLLIFQKSLLRSIDQNFLNNTFDMESTLETLARRLTLSKSITELGDEILQAVNSALNCKVADVLVQGPKGAEVLSTTGATWPIEPGSALFQLMCEAQSPAFLGEQTRLYDQLPTTDKVWLLDNEMVALAPLKGLSKTVGIVALGAKNNDLPYSREEFRMLELICNVAGVKCELLAGDHSIEKMPRVGVAYWCPGCENVQAADSICDMCRKPVEATNMPLLVGRKFRLLQRLGEGAGGVVYRAEDIELSRTVAIKTLPILGVNQALELKREARAMAQLSHPNLATVYDADTYKGRPSIIMEYIPNGTLAVAMNDGRALDLRLFITELCAAMIWIHERGIVHRDIKPENIGFGSSFEVKLMDFGLSKYLHQAKLDSVEKAVREGISGTLAYIQPEGFYKSIVDTSTDIWALCVVLAEVTVGCHPFREEQNQKTIGNILACQYSPNFAACIDTNIKVVLAPCFSKTKSARPKSVEEVRRLFLSLTPYGRNPDIQATV